jgi:glutamine amidotransferase
MGWNDLHYHTSCPLFRGIDEGKFVYFVHSFCADTADEKDLAAYAEYGERVTAAVFRDNVFGTQFHPEKSSGVGLKS